MVMVPSTPNDPAQRIDQTYGPDGLVQEIIHNYPPDGGGVRRWIDDQGQEQSEQVTGLPVPQPPERTTEDRIADAHEILSEAASLPAPTTPADLADILARAAEALNGGV